MYFGWSLVDYQRQDYKNFQYVYISLPIHATKEDNQS